MRRFRKNNDLVVSCKECQDRTLLAANEIVLSAIDASVEEEVLDVGAAQTEDYAHPVVAFCKSEEFIVSRANNKN